MKVLFWTDGFWPRLGGIETQSFEFIRAMQERGHEFRVVAQKDSPDWKEFELYEGIQIHRFSFNAVIEQRDLNPIRLVQQYIESVLRDFQPDILHLNTNVGGSLFVFSLFQKMFSVPIILTTYAPYLHEGKLPYLIQKIIASAHRVCCISDWVLEEMKKHVPSYAHKMRRIYCGLDGPKATPSCLPFSPPVLLSFGRLSWEKGFDTAIRAFALLNKRGSNAQFILAGGGPQRPALEQLAAELGVSVRFTGVLTEEERIQVLNQATLVVVPSIWESFGLVILEAMQMGRPVVASRIEGIPEVVADGKTGLLAAMKDPEAFCQAIEALLEDPNRAIQMGACGRKRAEQFTLQQNVTQYEELYNENFVLG